MINACTAWFYYYLRVYCSHYTTEGIALFLLKCRLVLGIRVWGKPFVFACSFVSLKCGIVSFSLWKPIDSRLCNMLNLRFDLSHYASLGKFQENSIGMASGLFQAPTFGVSMKRWQWYTSRLASDYDPPNGKRPSPLKRVQVWFQPALTLQPPLSFWSFVKGFPLAWLKSLHHPWKIWHLVKIPASLTGCEMTPEWAEDCDRLSFVPTLGAVVVARDDAQWDIVIGHPSLSRSAGLHSMLSRPSSSTGEWTNAWVTLVGSVRWYPEWTQMKFWVTPELQMSKTWYFIVSMLWNPGEPRDTGCTLYSRTI